MLSRTDTSSRSGLNHLHLWLIKTHWDNMDTNSQECASIWAYTLYSWSCSHGLNISTEHLEMLFWTSQSCHNTVTPTSWSRVGLGIIRLIYNPVITALLASLSSDINSLCSNIMGTAWISRFYEHVSWIL